MGIQGGLGYGGETNLLGVVAVNEGVHWGDLGERTQLGGMDWGIWKKRKSIKGEIPDPAWRFFLGGSSEGMESNQVKAGLIQGPVRKSSGQAGGILGLGSRLG